jgi:mycothiol synthase
MEKAAAGVELCLLEPVLPLLLAEDGTGVRVSGNLVMKWSCGKQAPQVPPPPGYKIRRYRDSDMGKLAGIYMKTYGLAYNENWYRKVILGSSLFSPDRCFVVEHAGKAVASALAWEDEKSRDLGRGVLHYVVSDPEHQRRGLAKVVSAAVMAYFQHDGRREIVLYTADFRVAALRAYLSLGFEAVEDTDEMRRRWENVRAALAAG